MVKFNPFCSLKTGFCILWMGLLSVSSLDRHLEYCHIKFNGKQRTEMHEEKISIHRNAIMCMWMCEWVSQCVVHHWEWQLQPIYWRPRKQLSPNAFIVQTETKDRKKKIKAILAFLFVIWKNFLFVSLHLLRIRSKSIGI